MSAREAVDSIVQRGGPKLLGLLADAWSTHCSPSGLASH